MPVPQHALKLQHFEANTQGRDFVVGDIHGCLEDLLTMLTMLEFDEAVDRLFSVGDLVDRGPNSRACAELIYEPWFFSIKGNHELMMCDSLVDHNQNARGMWLYNGGQWILSENQQEMTIVAQDINKLPLVITVGEGATRFNLVHAELMHWGLTQYVQLTDADIDQWVFTEEEENSMVWGRTIIQGTDPQSTTMKYHHPTDMSLTYVGHTPTRYPLVVQRHVYIDGGAVFNRTGRQTSHDNRLIIAEPAKELLHMYNTVFDPAAQILGQTGERITSMTKCTLDSLQHLV